MDGRLKEIRSGTSVAGGLAAAGGCTGTGFSGQRELGIPDIKVVFGML